MSMIAPLLKPAAADPDTDRRANIRHVTVLRVAKLKSGPAQGLGIIRNVSDVGMMLEVDPAFAVSDKVSIVIGEDHMFEGEVRWRQSSRWGVEFESSIDVDGVLAKPSRTRGGKTMRMQRVEVDCPCKLVVTDEVLDGTIADISLGGLRLAVGQDIPADTRIKLCIPGFCDAVGSVRWSKDGQIGVSFQTPLDIRQLMSWLASQNARPAAARIVTSR